ncbi:MAG TPA: 5-(carboxyamino)imidazole ribonucleotide synthase, partial [Chthonomonadales bacterium]|nr:5-(carboxyamino)imidazole ribonucleotide synthase [Chthonomonadales bacterium]
DMRKLTRFATGLSVVTYEFENVPVTSVRFLTRLVPVYPPPDALEAAQDRLNEKSLFRELKIPTPAFAPVDSLEELIRALERMGLPAVVKTRRLGYDGKGQQVLYAYAEAPRAWQALGGSRLIVENLIPFEREVSLIAVRGKEGQTAFYPLIENHHTEGILRLSLAPAPNLTPELQAEAEEYGRRILDALNYVGVLAVEFFQTQQGLLANEMAPRVHNSGHWSIEGAETSQFENHLRAILGLPLGLTEVRRPSAMLNLIGKIPDPATVLDVPHTHLHLYGKAARPGRKLGHVTVCAPSPEERAECLAQLCNRIRWRLPRTGNPQRAKPAVGK